MMQSICPVIYVAYYVIYHYTSKMPVRLRLGVKNNIQELFLLLHCNIIVVVYLITFFSDPGKCRSKCSSVSVLARHLFTPSNTKSKAVVFSDGFQDIRNATASMDALHKTYMPRKGRHINIGTLYHYTEQVLYFVKVIF
jgi:hypothetical protein